MRVSLTLSADSSQSIKQPFASLYWLFAIAPNRLFNVVTAIATKDKRNAEARPGEALLEGHAAAVALFPSVT